MSTLFYLSPLVGWILFTQTLCDVWMVIFVIVCIGSWPKQTHTNFKNSTAGQSVIGDATLIFWFFHPVHVPNNKIKKKKTIEFEYQMIENSFHLLWAIVLKSHNQMRNVSYVLNAECLHFIISNGLMAAADDDHKMGPIFCHSFCPFLPLNPFEKTEWIISFVPQWNLISVVMMT